MNYESLIDQLAEDLAPVRPRRFWVDVAIMAAIGATELFLIFAIGFANFDMQRIRDQPTVGWRLVSLATISAISGFFALRSFDPTYALKGSVRWIVAIVAVCIAYGVFLGSMPGGWSAVEQRLEWANGIECASHILLLSIPPLIALALLGRRGAPTDMRRTRFLVGLSAAAWGAFAFVFACPFNDPLFIITWYGLSCTLVVLLARHLLPRIARW